MRTGLGTVKSPNRPRIHQVFENKNQQTQQPELPLKEVQRSQAAVRTLNEHLRRDGSVEERTRGDENQSDVVARGIETIHRDNNVTRGTVQWQQQEGSCSSSSIIGDDKDYCNYNNYLTKKSKSCVKVDSERRLNEPSRKWWKLSSVLLNAVAAALVLTRGVTNSASLFWLKDLTQLNVEAGYCIGWYLNSVKVEDAAENEDAKMVTFEDEPICPGRSITDLTQEGHIDEEYVTMLHLVMLYVAFVPFLLFVLHPIVKASLIIMGIWPPCIKFRNCLIEIIAVSCLLGLMTPMLSLNPCPGDQFYCYQATVFEVRESPFCVRCDQFPVVSMVVWALTFSSFLFTITLLALGETPWLKKFGKTKSIKLSGFKETNLNKNMFLKASLYIFGGVAIVNIMTILSSPSSIFVLSCICSLVLLLTDNLIQYFLSRRRFKFEKVDNVLLWKVVRIDESDVSDDGYETDSESDIDKVDVPQKVIHMMADEKRACLNLFSTQILHDADIPIDIHQMNNQSSQELQQQYDYRMALRDYKLKQNLFLLESAHEDSYSLSISVYRKDALSRLNEEVCIACTERSRTVLMAPCHHLAYCRQCYANVIRVRTASREMEHNRISLKIGGRHKFIQACFQKLRRFGKDELKMLQQNETLILPEANRNAFVFTCPLCRDEITESILLEDDSEAKRNRIRGKLLHIFDYDRLDVSLASFRDQRLNSIELQILLLSNFSSGERSNMNLFNLSESSSYSVSFVSPDSYSVGRLEYTEPSLLSLTSVEFDVTTDVGSNFCTDIIAVSDPDDP